MVIPMGGGAGGGGDAYTNVISMRTIPDQLIPRFRIIKACLIVLIVSLVVKLIAAAMLDPNDLFNWIWNSLNPILITVIGIFLLKDDPLFGRAYNCCLMSICASCQDSCPGGMSCLCTWFFCCTLTAVFDLIPINGTSCSNTSTTAIMTIICGIDKLNDRSQWEGGELWLVKYSIFVAATFFALMSQLIGAFQGWKAFSEASALAEGDGVTGGGYGDPYGREEGGGGGGGGGWFSGGGGGNSNQARDWGGGQALGGGGGGGSARNQPSAPPRGNPNNNGFVAFGGAGQRLGS